MKRIFLTVALLLSFAFASFADEGRGSCIVTGTDSDYIEVTAYCDGKGCGNFVIANSATKPLMSLYIVITAEVSTTISGETFQTVTLYSGNYTGKIESYASTTVEFTHPKSYQRIRNIQVTVSNPTCK